MDSTNTGLSDDEIIAKWTHGPDRLYRCRVVMRDVSLGPRHVPVRAPTASSSLGQLDRLPMELLGEILEHLDVMSAWQLSRVCLLSKAMVESFPKYHQLVEGAGIFFQTLKTTQVLSRACVSTLHAALYSEKCVSCGAYGPLLHLVELVRCCFLCVELNVSLWVAPPSWTQNCFHLDRRVWERRPLMASQPGRYGLRVGASHEGSIPLTSIGAIQRLALQQYGSLAALEAAYPLRWASSRGIATSQSMFRRWRDAPLGPMPTAPLHCDPYGDAPRDRFQCMGVMRFPSRAGGSAETGLFCRACEQNLARHRARQMSGEEQAALVPGGYDPLSFLDRARQRAWSRNDFPVHVRAEHPQLLEGGAL